MPKPKPKPLEAMTVEELEQHMAELDAQREALRGQQREAKAAHVVALERRDAADAAERRLNGSVQTATADAASLNAKGD